MRLVNPALILAGCLALPLAATEKPVNRVKPKLAPAPLGSVHFSGRIGQCLDRVIAARFRSETARTGIVPEAVEAFRRRVDDRLREGVGLWQGEFWGKWTLAAVAACQYTGDTQLKELVASGTRGVIATQRPDGYIGTYSNSAFLIGNNWNVWCRKYTLWGLLAAYQLLEDPAILEAARRLVDHLMTEVGPGKVDIVRTGNFFGLPSSSILTPLVELYRQTGDPRYLTYARYIVDNWSKYPGQPPDIVNRGLTGEPVHRWFPQYMAGHQSWTKAYEFISCVEGLLDLYEVDPDPRYFQAARNIHAAIHHHDRVITGGIGDDDKLLGAAARPDGLNEPCDVVYWERLSAKLLELTGEPEYADEIERLAYNVLLTAVNEDGSWGLRRLGLSEPHLIAPLHCMLRYHHCCVNNVPRGLLQLAQLAVMRRLADGGLVINLYIPARASLRFPGGNGVQLLIDTRYPASGLVRIEIRTASPQRFPLLLRIPPWSRDTGIRVNGRKLQDAQPGSYFAVDRVWHRDVVEISFDLRPRVEWLSDGNRRYVAILYGPVVLARSARVDPGSVHAALELPDVARFTLEELAPPGDVWMLFRLEDRRGQRAYLCDYASTPGSYERPRDPAAHAWMRNNRTGWDLRVWLPVE